MITANEWLEKLPELPGTDRDTYILQAISSGLAVCEWAEITSSIKDHVGKFYVSSDAVWILLEDNSRFRFQVSASLAQKCADLVGGMLPTAKISDLAYKQAATVLSVTILPAGPDMVTTSKSKLWNTKVEAKRTGREGLIRDCGKAWILDNALAHSAGAINYGFYDKAAPYIGPGGLKMWQTIGTRHDAKHTDYSQTLILMSQACEVDGQKMKTVEVMTSSALSGLVSYQGLLKYTRQPI